MVAVAVAVVVVVGDAVVFAVAVGIAVGVAVAVSVMTGRRRNPRDGELVPVECWCTETIVWIDVVEVRRGRTRSCGRPDCRPAQSDRKTRE